MKKLPFLCLLLLTACNSNPDKPKAGASENDLDAARNFIRAALDGKWNEARTYMLADSSNVERLNIVEEFYQKETAEVKRGYREAEIRTYDTQKIGDSVSIVSYANTYKNEKNQLKLVKINGQWLVDLKYSFLPTDSAKNVH